MQKSDLMGFRKLMTLNDGTALVNDDAISRLVEMGFFKAPASTKYHGVMEGGLYLHSRSVTNALLFMTDKLQLEWQLPRLPYIVGMFHDLCKADQYRYSSSIDNYEYRTDTLFKGHGEKSVMLLSQFYTLTEEEIACICYHMGAFTDKEEWSAYTRAVSRYPNVLYTHTADMVATHIFGK